MVCHPTLDYLKIWSFCLSICIFHLRFNLFRLFFLLLLFFFFFFRFLSNRRHLLFLLWPHTHLLHSNLRPFYLFVHIYNLTRLILQHLLILRLQSLMCQNSSLSSFIYYRNDFKQIFSLQVVFWWGTIWTTTRPFFTIDNEIFINFKLLSYQFLELVLFIFFKVLLVRIFEVVFGFYRCCFKFRLDENTSVS